jgi:hypothetical protein
MYILYCVFQVNAFAFILVNLSDYVAVKFFHTTDGYEGSEFLLFSKRILDLIIIEVERQKKKKYPYCDMAYVTVCLLRFLLNIRRRRLSIMTSIIFIYIY